MNHSSREHWLLTIFPAAIIGLLMFGYFRPTRDLSRLRTAADKLPLGAETDQVAFASRVQRDELRKQLQTLESERELLIQRWYGLNESLQHSTDRPKTIDHLTKVLLKNQLQVISKQALTNSNEGFSGDLQRIERRLKQPVETAFPELKKVSNASSDNRPAQDANGVQRAVWEISLVGTYADMQQAMKDIVEGDKSVTPLLIEMEESHPELKLRQWKLVLTF